MMPNSKLLLTVFVLCTVLPAMSQAQIARRPVETPPAAATPKPAEKDLMPPIGKDLGASTYKYAADEDTHPILNMTPDKSELVRLSRDAASVVVGNSAHVAVMLDSPRLAVVIPRQPGSTYFSVLDKDGEIVMQRHIVVAAPKKNYVRVRRSCANVPQGTACQPTSVYFCPDMCHEIGSAAPAESGDAGTAPATAE